jgi:MFS family permease
MRGNPLRGPVRRLVLARVLSGIGGSAAFVALPFDIYQRTGSTAWASWTFLITFALRGMVSLAGGAIADRLDRRRVMIASDLLAGACWLAMAFAGAPVWLLGLAFVAVVVSVPNWFAATAALPNLVTPDELTRSNATLSAAANVGFLVGPAIGGALIVVLSPAWVYGLDAASFAASAAIVATIRRSFAGDAVDEVGQDASSLRAAFRWIIREPALRGLLLLWAITGPAFDIAFVADLPLVSLFGVGAVGYGILNSVLGVGALVAAVAARRMQARWEAPAIIGGTVGLAVAYLLVAIAPWFWLVVVWLMLGALADTLAEVGGDGLVQRRAPDRMRGRIFGVLSMASFLASAGGFAVAGPLVDALGPRGVYALGGAISLAAAIVLSPMVGATRVAGSSVETGPIRPASP